MADFTKLIPEAQARKLLARAREIDNPSLIEITPSERRAIDHFEAMKKNPPAQLTLDDFLARAQVSASTFDAPEAVKPTKIDLSPDQASVFDDLRAWALDPAGVLTMGGFAGSGKTTLAGLFAREVCPKMAVAFVSFTGRAAGVLARKLAEAGVRTTTELADADNDMRGSRTPLCTTIHRLLYKPIIDKTTEEIRGWTKRTEPDRPYRLIVIDEASMVGDRLLADIKAFGIPILAIGDHGQLPPVQDSGSLMRSPRLRLEKIHRQAADNPIIQLAHHIRTRGTLLPTKPSHGGAILYRTRAQALSVLRNRLKLTRSISDIGILCYQNRTRVILNNMARQALGIKGVPVAGETVVCLKNIQEELIWNGMRGRLAKDAQPGQQPWHLDLNVEFPEEMIPDRRLTVCSPQFCRERPYKDVLELQDRGVDVSKMGSAGHLFDFGYAMTVHKYQGSQVREAIIYLDRPVVPGSQDWRRFMYTAVTRASEKLVIIR